MADGTRLDVMEQSIAGIREVLTHQGRQISQNIQQLQVLTDSLIVTMKRFTDIDVKLDQLTESLKALESASPSDSSDKGKNVGSESVIGRSTSDRGITLPNKNSARPPRLDFPRFDGSDPLGWIFKAEQFFTYHQTPEEQKLTLASFYMDGDALAWFQWAHKNTAVVDWEDFTQALSGRFGPSNVEDQHGRSKSVQTGSLADHQSSRSICTAECSSGEGCHFFHRPGGYNAMAQMSNQENPAAHPASKNLIVPAQISDGQTATKACLCNKFNTPERCRFGENCHFAHHGKRELGRPTFSGHETSMAPPMGDRLGVWQESQAPPSLGASAAFGASATAKISVDAWLSGPIIGKGGVNTKHVCRTTGAKLYIRDHESDSNLKNIELEGTFDQIKHATGMVEELIVNISSGMHVPAKPEVGAGDGGLGYGYSSGHGPAAGRNNFKTKICERFDKGFCSFGDRCNFAHGSNELRKGWVA